MKITFWWFVAVIFLLYGLIIFGSGVYYWVEKISGPNVNIHVSIWWGLVLCAVSAIFFAVNKRN